MEQSIRNQVEALIMQMPIRTVQKFNVAGVRGYVQSETTGTHVRVENNPLYTIANGTVTRRGARLSSHVEHVSAQIRAAKRQHAREAN